MVAVQNGVSFATSKASFPHHSDVRSEDAASVNLTQHRTIAKHDLHMQLCYTKMKESKSQQKLQEFPLQVTNLHAEN